MAGIEFARGAKGAIYYRARLAKKVTGHTKSFKTMAEAVAWIKEKGEEYKPQTSIKKEVIKSDLSIYEMFEIVMLRLELLEAKLTNIQGSIT